MEVEFDKGAKDITRVFFTTTEKELIYLDDEIYKQESAEILKQRIKTNFTNETNLKNISSNTKDNSRNSCNSSEFVVEKEYPQVYHGIPFKDIIAKYWELNNHGFEPTIGDRDTLTYQLACDLRHICGKNADWLDQVIPCYNGFTPEEKRAKIQNALSSEYNGFPQRLRNTLNALTSPNPSQGGEGLADEGDDDDAVANSTLSTLNSTLKRMPMGIRESIDAVGPTLAMPVITAICPCIGTLATGVTLDVHGAKRGLNLIAYIAGDFASGKGGIDPVVEAWMSDFSVMLRQSYDGTKYEREARSAEAYDVIADSLLENALYFFRDRIENAFMSCKYVGNLNGERTKRGKNDSIFGRLDIQFTFEQAMQHSVAVKGANVTHNTVRQMLKNWRKQKLVVLEEDGNYRKIKN